MNFKRLLTKFSLGYDATNAPYTSQRRPAYIETKKEDEHTGATSRNKLINLHRDTMRNSPIRVMQDQQIRVNVVGNDGGKMYADFGPGNEEAALAVMKFFNRTWSQHCEFTFNQNLNWLLKTTLTSMDSNGNVILIFDDGFLSGGTGTGKVRAFEGDEIANVPDGEFNKHFPMGFVQRGGFVYDKLGRFCGCFVSSSQRGCDVFDPQKGYIVLRRDPNSYDDPAWLCVGDMRRFNQGRAISPFTSAITTMVDLHEIMGSETQAAKLNSQLFGTIVESAEADADAGNPSVGFDDGEAYGAPAVRNFQLKNLASIHARIDQLPEGLSLKELDTKRPNPNMEGFIDFLSGTAGASRGLARVYSNMKAQTSYTAFRGEQLMTWASFEEMQKNLERTILDPLAFKVIDWAIKTRRLDVTLPEDWQDGIGWKWPKMREINPTDTYNAYAKALELGLTTRKRLLGPGEVEAIDRERLAEKAFNDENGFITPGTQTVSGQMVNVAPEVNNDNEEE